MTREEEYWGVKKNHTIEEPLLDDFKYVVIKLESLLVDEPRLRLEMPQNFVLGYYKNNNKGNSLSKLIRLVVKLHLDRAQTMITILIEGSGNINAIKIFEERWIFRGLTHATKRTTVCVRRPYSFCQGRADENKINFYTFIQRLSEVQYRIKSTLMKKSPLWVFV